MAALVCLVRQLRPVAVLTLAGTLDDRSSLRAGLALRDCLAAQPAAVVVDVHRLGVVGDRPIAWLHRICEEARTWPGAPVYFVDPDRVTSPLPGPSFDRYDAAMTVANGQPIPPSHTMTLAPVATSCAAVRAAVRRCCADWRIPRFGQTGEIIASEMVANAIVHARTDLTVAIRAVNGLQISVTDSDPRMVPEESILHGAGMEIVNGLADRWGCLPTSAGKVVWACINSAPREPGVDMSRTRV